VQCTPSPAPEPRMTFLSTAPSESWNIGGWDSSCPPDEMP